MSEVRRGLLLKVLEPVEWHIHIVKTGGDRCRMSYTEVVERPSDMSREEFREAVKVGVEAGVAAYSDWASVCDVRCEWEGEDRVRVAIEVEGNRSGILSSVGGEFICMSKLGDMTLRELITFAAVGVMATEERGRGRGER
mgnify:CR=1 FL=1